MLVTDSADFSTKLWDDATVTVTRTFLGRDAPIGNLLALDASKRRFGSMG